ncbi:TPA: hypothetical protein ACXNIM_001269 [Stenotrophomonas maltophilia]
MLEIAPSATSIGGAAICTARSTAMNAPKLRPLHATRDPAKAEPERHPMPARCMELADADCALAGLRVVQEVLLAAERTRQNGAPEEYLGDRVMEGLMMACVALTAQVVERLQTDG